MVHLNAKTNYSLFAQCLATAGVTILMTQTGIMGGWTSPNMARLTGENATIPLSLSEASWVASCLNLGRFVSVVLVPTLIELAGSKKTILFSFLPVSVGWVLTMLANSAIWLCAARFLSGITYGLAYGCFSIFLGEISVTAYRGTFISIAMTGWPIGALVGTIAETYLPMTVTSMIYLVQCLMGIILFMWLPESPYHLVKIDDIVGAQKSISWYRGGKDVEMELNEIRTFVESNGKQKFSDKMRQLKSTPMRKSMALVIMLFSFQQMCGLFNIEFYMEMILTKAESFLVDPREAVIYANVVLLVSTVISINLIDKLGRKALLIVSSIGVTVALTGLSLHFHLLSYWAVDPRNIQWLPIASIVFFTITFTTGFMSVPSCVLSEIFPTGLKGTAACITSLTSAFFGFFASKSYLPMVDAIGETYVFGIHAVFSALALPVALSPMMPETKGKTFQEIQDAILKNELYLRYPQSSDQI